MSDQQLRKITQYFNEKVWDRGEIPSQWKEAKILLIPKPGKDKTLHNLRPIYLTSCLGKLFETVVHTRLSDYIEKGNYLSDMYGFRQHLSTQDIFLRIKDEVLQNVTTGGENVVAALDLRQAFDTISHRLIMEELQSLNCGARTFHYRPSALQL